MRSQAQGLAASGGFTVSLRRAQSSRVAFVYRCLQI